jgi:hypothetical protein
MQNILKRQKCALLMHEFFVCMKIILKEYFVFGIAF